MQTYAPITLNDGWCYFFSDNARASFNTVDLNSLPWIPLPKLSDWMITSTVHFGADWFWRSISLDMSDPLTTVHLKMDKVPDSVAVYINGTEVTGVHGRRGISADVTPYLHSGTNNIVIKLVCNRCSNGGRFVNVHLQPSRNDNVVYAY
ncbi:MAG: hypothetical protein SAK29_42490 [Scytonema sp. PMC 1069.18]|nr:hypothetical protein [Scytonema sp. PMC 1069.18]